MSDLSAPKNIGALAKLLLSRLGGTSVSPQLARARAAYVWTTHNIGYSLARRPTPDSTIAAGTGNCEAHAMLFSALCESMGVECTKVTGYLRFPYAPGAALADATKRLAPGQWLVAHAWNAIRIGGQWGLVDTTLGTPAGPVQPDDYFLVDPAVFATDHIPDDPNQALGADVSLTTVAEAPLIRPLSWRTLANFDVQDFKAKLRSDESKVIVHIPWSPKMRAAVQTESGGVEDAALVQPHAPLGCSYGGGDLAGAKFETEIHVCSPKTGAVAWLGVGSGQSWRPLVGYPVVGSTPQRLPTPMTQFYDRQAVLVGPFTRDLPAGQTTEIRIHAPLASRVIAFQGPEVAGTFERDGDTWVLRTKPASGAALQIMASYENQSHFQGLLAYKVR